MFLQKAAGSSRKSLKSFDYRVIVMFGSKKEIYIGKENDTSRALIADLKSKGIKYEIVREGSHAADIGRGAGVGRYGENSNGDTIRILVRKKDYGT